MICSKKLNIVIVNYCLYENKCFKFPLSLPLLLHPVLRLHVHACRRDDRRLRADAFRGAVAAAEGGREGAGKAQAQHGITDSKQIVNSFVGK